MCKARSPTGRLINCWSIRRRLSLVVAALILTLCPLPLIAQELIANPDWPATPLDRNQARLYFTLRLRLLDNQIPINVFVLPDDHPLHRQFAKNILGLFPYQLRQVWDRQLFSGTGQAPNTVSSEQEMLERVGSTPGAIGYTASGSNPPQVRILEVR
jgi:ABC-type phosphate transport system substrate-binding protein